MNNQKLQIVGSFSGENLVDKYYQISLEHDTFYLRMPDEIYGGSFFLTTVYTVYIYTTLVSKEWYIAIKGSNTANWLGSDSPSINQCFSQT
jgi:hypothetical protein